MHKPDAPADGPTTDKEVILIKEELPLAEIKVKKPKEPSSPSDESASNFSDVLEKNKEVEAKRRTRTAQNRKKNYKKNT